MNITKEENKLYITFLYNPLIVEKIKKCPSRKWVPSQKRWEAPLSSLLWLLNEFPSADYHNLDSEIQSLALKQKTHQQLNKSFDESYIPHPALYKFQVETIRQALKSEQGFLIFLKMGLGKTVIALEIIKYLKQHSVSPALVVCPLDLINGAWINDVKKFENESLSIVNLRHEPSIPEGYDIYCINYEMFKKRLLELQDFGFRILVIDESSKIKDNKTQQTKRIIDFADSVDYTYCLSGTPAPNSELEYWAQLHVVGAVTDNFYKWRNTWFYQAGYNWRLKRNKKEDFMKQFEGKAVFMEKEEAIPELPGKIAVEIPIELSREERVMYNKTYGEFKSEINKLWHDVKNGDISEQEVVFKYGQLTNKLRQPISGFLYEDGSVMWEAKKPSKIEVLRELLESIGNEQVIVWTQFKQEKEQILKQFKNIYKIGCFTGDESDKEKEESRLGFVNGYYQILLANTACGQYGLSFQNCNYMIYYSRNFSLQQWEQSLERTDRPGQKKTTFYYVFKMIDTIDEKIDEVLTNKKKMSLDILRSI